MINSRNLYQRAKTVIPGGVNSPVRAFKAVDGEPIFFKRGSGAYLFDVDDHQYIDYVCAWGCLLLGHCQEQVIASVNAALQNGTTFGASTELEVLLAEKIISLMPSIEQIRMVNSGTEATMTAIRLARGFTGKNKIIKFNGCYHGAHDSVLVKAGSGLLTLTLPASRGIPATVVLHTLTADFNNLDETAALFAQHPHDIAAVIVEPVAGNMGFLLPDADFLPGLRSLCDHYNALLIFDEVITGFRVALGGAQAIFNCYPDLTTLGKVIGGGLPIGAVGGRSEIMACLAPLGEVYQAGTLAGNPLAMAAGISTLNKLSPEFYDKLAKNTDYLVRGLVELATYFKLPFYADSLGGMFGFSFNKQLIIKNYNDLAAADASLFKRFFHGMLKQGINFAPSMFEVGFVSAAHQNKEIMMTHQAAEIVFAAL